MNISRMRTAGLLQLRCVTPGSAIRCVPTAGHISDRDMAYVSDLTEC
jgi:hypothetical protein